MAKRKVHQRIWEGTSDRFFCKCNYRLRGVILENSVDDEAQVTCLKCLNDASELQRAAYTMSRNLGNIAMSRKCMQIVYSQLGWNSDGFNSILDVVQQEIRLRYQAKKQELAK